MAEPKGERLRVYLPASQVRKRLQGHGFGVRKVQSAGRGQALIIHTATGQHRRELEALFADARQPRDDARELAGGQSQTERSPPSAAGRAGEKKKPLRPAREAADTPVEQLRNLGPISSGWLREVGIRTRGDLERIGPVMAFQRVRERRPRCSRNLLWALAGALRDTDWRELPAAVRQQLRRDAEG